MRVKVVVLLGVLLWCALVPSSGVASPSSTAFTYQGRLNDGGNPANGLYDLRFTIYDSTNSPGTVIAGPVTNSAVSVSNGLFTVTLDFGTGVFTGPFRALDIGVRTNGNTGAFTILSPRQPLLPAPYAIFANTASNLSGALPASQLAGTLPASAFAGYTNTVALTNSGNLFAGSFSGTFGGAFSGSFAGDGGNVTNVSVTHLTGVLADNQLPANTPFLDSNQLYSGANIFTNFNNSFRGSFFGNGLVGWVPTNGVAIQAVRDTGYLVTNSQQATVTLPLAANVVVGDIVRISGPGGWLIAQNSGQSIIGDFNGYNQSSWTISGASTISPWSAMAASADGTRLAATIYGGGIYISVDGGRNWTATSATSRSYKGIASSADGSKLAAVVNGSYVYTSTDSGNTWQARTSSPSTSWTAVASSDDGTKLLAVGSSGVYVSTDSGATWTGRVGGSSWTSAAVSADGTQMAAAGGTVYVSSNTGSSWSSTSGSGSYVTMSGDGTKLVVVGSGIYTSTDFGSTWVHRTTGVPAGSWTSVASSSDGNLLAATLSGGGIYTSVNGGAVWTQQSGEPNAAWSAITSSSDGTKLAAAINSNTSGGIYTMQASSVSQTTVGTTGGIAGGQGAVELQYIGNNQFMPVSFAGNIWAY